MITVPRLLAVIAAAVPLALAVPVAAFASGNDLTDLAGQSAYLGNGHGQPVEWSASNHTDLGFALVGGTGNGDKIFQIGAGGQCLNVAATGSTVWEDNCAAPNVANEEWVQTACVSGQCVYQILARWLNLTASQSAGILVIAGGGRSDYNVWTAPGS